MATDKSLLQGRPEPQVPLLAKLCGRRSALRLMLDAILLREHTAMQLRSFFYSWRCCPGCLASEPCCVRRDSMSKGFAAV